MTTSERLVIVISELLKRLTTEERIELMRHISWEELEEWKATQESLADAELMANLRMGLADEKKGRLTEVKI